MRLAVLWLFALPCLAQEADVQRALIERDQRTVEFAARVRGAPLVELQRLENTAARQLLEVHRGLPPELRPYERQKAAREFVLRLPPPVERAAVSEKPRPLRPEIPHVVDLVGEAAIAPPAAALQNLTEDRPLR
jgi:hypothetical protein